MVILIFKYSHYVNRDFPARKSGNVTLEVIFSSNYRTST